MKTTKFYDMNGKQIHEGDILLSRRANELAFVKIYNEIPQIIYHKGFKMPLEDMLNLDSLVIVSTLDLTPNLIEQIWNGEDSLVPKWEKK